MEKIRTFIIILCMHVFTFYDIISELLPYFSAYKLKSREINNGKLV
jgi:hypothetical protein